MENIKLIKKMVHLQIKKQLSGLVVILAVVLAGGMIMSLLTVFEYIRGDLTRNYIENTNFFLLLISGIILAVSMAMEIYQDDVIANFPGNAKTRFVAKIISHGIIILEYACMLAAAYGLMALLYLGLNKIKGVYIPGVFDWEYMAKGILYFICEIVIFYSIFSLIALIVRLFGIYGILGGFGLIVISVIANAEKIFYGMTTWNMSLVGIVGLRILLVMAAGLLVIVLLFHIIAVIKMKTWKKSSAVDKGIYLGTEFILLIIIFGLTSFGAIFMYDGFGSAGMDIETGVKEKLVNAKENQTAERLLEIPIRNIEQIVSQKEDGFSDLEYQLNEFFRDELNAAGQMNIGGCTNTLTFEIVPESKAPEYGISLPGKLEYEQAYIKFYFENVSFNGDFLLQSTIDSINESLVIQNEKFYCEEPAKKITLINDFFGDRAMVTFEKYSLLQPDVTIALVVRDEDMV